MKQQFALVSNRWRALGIYALEAFFFRGLLKIADALEVVSSEVDLGSFFAHMILNKRKCLLVCLVMWSCS